MSKYAIIVASAVVALAWTSAPVAAQSGGRNTVFNPFSVRPTVERQFSFRNFTSQRSNPFASPIVSTSEAETPLMLMMEGESASSSEEPIVSFGMVGRPPYVPPVRSPFRPPPRPPFGP